MLSAECKYQISFGGEAPCCRLKWQFVLNDPGYAERALLDGKNTPLKKPPTACEQGGMGRYCLEASEK